MPSPWCWRGSIGLQSRLAALALVSNVLIKSWVLQQVSFFLLRPLHPLLQYSTASGSCLPRFFQHSLLTPTEEPLQPGQLPHQLQETKKSLGKWSSSVPGGRGTGVLNASTRVIPIKPHCSRWGGNQLGSRVMQLLPTAHHDAQWHNAVLRERQLGLGHGAQNWGTDISLGWHISHCAFVQHPALWGPDLCCGLWMLLSSKSYLLQHDESQHRDDSFPPPGSLQREAGGTKSCLS